MDDVGGIFALTDNTKLNLLACHRWSERLHHPSAMVRGEGHLKKDRKLRALIAKQFMI